MTIKNVNFRGYKTSAARARRAKREGGSLSALIEAMHFVGMNDEEIKAELLKMKAVAQPALQLPPAIPPESDETMDEMIARGVCPACTWRGEMSLKNGVCVYCAGNWL